MISASSRRSVAILVAGAVTAALCVILIQGIRTPPNAIAGPCADKAALYYDIPDQVLPVEQDAGYVTRQQNYYRQYFVKANPDVPPPSKPQPYLQINIHPAGGQDPQIVVFFSPNEAGESFSTVLYVDIGPLAVPGKHSYQIEILCHPTDPVVTMVDFDLWVDACPAPTTNSSTQDSTDAQPLADTPTPVPFPTDCSAATDTPGPSVSPTPTPRPGNVTWGDVDCSAGSSLTNEDALAILKHAIEQTPTPPATPIVTPPPTPTPGPCFLWKVLVKISQVFGFHVAANGGLEVEWGDFNCSGAADAGDALSVLRYLAGFTDQFPQACPQIGERVQVDPA